MLYLWNLLIKCLKRIGFRWFRYIRFDSLRKQSRGSEVTVLIKEVETGVKVSLRSKNKVDVRMIAEGFNGGGHIRAAGFVAEDNIQTVREINNYIRKRVDIMNLNRDNKDISNKKNIFGILNVYKPRKITSFDVVRVIKAYQ